MRHILPILLISLLTNISLAVAEENQPDSVPEPPELPPQIVSGETMSPDITITRKKKDDVTEYSVNGSTYMVKISPANAPAYYMVDTDGDGSLETRKSDLEKGLNIPQWLLHSW